jgi:hypothetical protein
MQGDVGERLEVELHGHEHAWSVQWRRPQKDVTLAFVRFNPHVKELHSLSMTS